MTARQTFRGAARDLAERDPVIGDLVVRLGLPRIPPPIESHFESLVRAITYQQLATTAAATIHRRLLGVLEEDVRPERLIDVEPERLRAAGLSTNKAAALHDLADKVLAGEVVLEARRLRGESDEEIVARLTSVRGIGTWTADVFLIFQLRRLDVWPTGDLSVRKGFALAWGVPLPSPKELAQLGEPYHPYRSVVAWYCWQVVGLDGPAR